MEGNVFCFILLSVWFGLGFVWGIGFSFDWLVGFFGVVPITCQVLNKYLLSGVKRRRNLVTGPVLSAMYCIPRTYHNAM